MKISNLVELCIKNIKDPECRIADAWTMVLSNISRSSELAEQVFTDMKDHIEELVNVFSRIDYNKHKCHLNYLGKWNTLLCKNGFGRLINSFFFFVQVQSLVMYHK